MNHTGPAVPQHETVLIPIAGGKGGIGKSIIAANLGIALADLGHETVVVDLDLGGSNLHSYLGLGNNLPGIGDYVHHREGQLEDYLHLTQHKRLRFLPGDGRTPFLANLSYTNKTRLAARLHAIPARYVLLDLGAGSSFNTLDFFSMAPQGMLVTTRERPAMFGMLQFMKNFVLRMIERGLKEYDGASDVLRSFLATPIDGGPMTVEKLVASLEPVDSRAAQAISSIAARYRPRIVLNEATSDGDAHRLAQAMAAMNKVLAVCADHFGTILEDGAVADAVERDLPLLDAAPESIAARNIVTIAERIVRDWEAPTDSGTG